MLMMLSALQLMLMMLVVLGHLPGKSPPDADDARFWRSAWCGWYWYLCKKLLMMLACLGHLPCERPHDADNVGCFGARVQEAAQPC